MSKISSKGRVAFSVGTSSGAAAGGSEGLEEG